ncbi:MAG: alpha-L-rhamnosidase C-terminal domain-containing protein [Bacteroidota bacterium]
MTKTLTILGLILIFSSISIYSQIPDPSLPAELINNPWSGKWIAVAGEPAKDYGVYHFRKKILLEEKPDTFLVHVSGDNRYKLFVNGKLVCLGPARGDVRHWNFETIDIAPFLHPGVNIIASVVWNFDERDSPVAQMSLRTGFIMQGNGPKERIIDTDKTWKGIRDQAYSSVISNLNAFFVVGPGENIESNKYPWGWESENFDDSNWKEATEISSGLAGGMFYNWVEDWQLTPRTIPAMDLIPQRLKIVRRVTGINSPGNFPREVSAFTVPANTKAVLLLDQGFETTAYPVLTITGGMNAGIRLQYAEALYDKGGDQNSKGNRNEIENKIFKGYEDIIASDGGKNRIYNTLWWRTYRYINLIVETKDDPLIINDLYGIYTGYPFRMQSVFEAKDHPELNKILEVGWRSARLCAQETYTDCPYYEQLQYVGDTRIQALVSLYNSGDDRLMRNAIIQIRNSHGLDGITQSRYPTSIQQYIPPFSLWWIAMLDDYYKYRGDESFIKDQLPVSRAILHFFESKQMTDGSLGNVPYWNFTDWAETWNNGIPPKTINGFSAPLDFQLLLAYQTAMYLEKSVGLSDFVSLYQQRADQLKQLTKTIYRDSARGEFADTPEKKIFSQHTNILAILTGVVEGDEARKLMEKVLNDKSLTQATIYFKYYLHQALVKSGLGNCYLDLLDEWSNQLSRGLTTWAESPEPTRSDCHAWGASPNIEFYRILLGIDSDAPGFGKVKIEPNLGDLKSVMGEIPHPAGKISASYHFENGKWNIEIGLPKTISGYLLWKGKRYELKEGINNWIIE